MPKPSALNQGHAFFVVVYAMSTRITRTSNPAASATYLKICSVIRPGGRSPLPNPRGAGAGRSLGRGGAVTAILRVRNLREMACDERGHGTGGGSASRAHPARRHAAGATILFSWAFAFAKSVFGIG